MLARLVGHRLDPLDDDGKLVSLRAHGLDVGVQREHAGLVAHAGNYHGYVLDVVSPIAQFHDGGDRFVTDLDEFVGGRVDVLRASSPTLAAFRAATADWSTCSAVPATPFVLAETPPTLLWQRLCAPPTGFDIALSDLLDVV